MRVRRKFVLTILMISLGLVSQAFTLKGEYSGKDVVDLKLYEMFGAFPSLVKTIPVVSGKISTELDVKNGVYLLGESKTVASQIALDGSDVKIKITNERFN